MSSVHNSVETVNAAATAIVTAESRVQPSTVQKRRWGSCWSLYWCFGSHKPNKRIGHAVLVPEPTPPGVEAPVAENRNHSATIVLPFIAPPSSPASFLQSDPPSATQSPAGLLSLTALSVNVYSPGGTAPIFAVGPYAHETQLVSPPVFSAFTTEPSTACFTPPPESVQITTPSSPEVPFAQLLTSSLARNRRNNGTNLKFSLSQYDFQPYQYPGSPGGRLKSPGSAISTSGTSSPFPDKLPIVEFRKGEAPKFLGYEHFANRKWGSRVGSGSLTPTGWGSRLGSGTLTPNGGLSRLGSGTVTPNGGEPPSQDSYLLESQISEVASLANSDNESKDGEVVVDYRVSFELIGEDIPTCTIKESVPSYKTALKTVPEAAPNGMNQKDMMAKNTDCCREYSDGETVSEVPDMARRHRTISLGSSKDFNFNNAKEEVLEKSTVDCEWWTNDKVPKKELGPRKDWTFFPMLQPGVS
ncbi:hydroxyproline-rich glycoprotein family protein [Forsythia ovata]|uniref:Hydroxyproline-rich glycoprotein family protein n=1 Tax=Forsythia ovata TaxID=205694 RepID=A0ABD1WP25_9LAMI